MDLRESTPSLCSRPRWLEMRHCKRHALNFSMDGVQMYLAHNEIQRLCPALQLANCCRVLAVFISRFKVDREPMAAQKRFYRRKRLYSVCNAVIDAKRRRRSGLVWSGWRRRKRQELKNRFHAFWTAITANDVYRPMVVACVLPWRFDGSKHRRQRQLVRLLLKWLPRHINSEYLLQR